MCQLCAVAEEKPRALRGVRMDISVRSIIQQQTNEDSRIRIQASVNIGLALTQPRTVELSDVREKHMVALFYMYIQNESPRGNDSSN